MPLSITVRKSEERGHANHGWLDSYHTFSFAGYYSADFEKFGTLRVLNEDRVKPNRGFGTHPHRDFEIFSYIVSGELDHTDSMGSKETIKRGDVQFTSAGKGISHSEYNNNPTETVHFLQIWVKPEELGLQPSYSTSHFTEEEKTNRLCRIVSGKKNITKDATDRSLKINQDVDVFCCLLGKGKELKVEMEEGRKYFLHLVQNGGKVVVDNKIELEGGDGAFIVLPKSQQQQKHQLKIVGVNDQSEFLLFDLKE